MKCNEDNVRVGLNLVNIITIGPHQVQRFFNGEEISPIHLGNIGTQRPRLSVVSGRKYHLHIVKLERRPRVTVSRSKVR